MFFSRVFVATIRSIGTTKPVRFVDVGETSSDRRESLFNFAGNRVVVGLYGNVYNLASLGFKRFSK